MLFHVKKPQQFSNIIFKYEKRNFRFLCLIKHLLPHYKELEGGV